MRSLTELEYSKGNPVRNVVLLLKILTEPLNPGNVFRFSFKNALCCSKEQKFLLTSKASEAAFRTNFSYKIYIEKGYLYENVIEILS